MADARIYVVGATLAPLQSPEIMCVNRSPKKMYFCSGDISVECKTTITWRQSNILNFVFSLTAIRNQPLKLRIFHSSRGLLSCDAVQGCGRIPTFPRSTLPPSTGGTSPWRQRQQTLPKRWYPTATLHSVITQNTSTWTLPGGNTSNFEWINITFCYEDTLWTLLQITVNSKCIRQMFTYEDSA